MMNKYLQTDIRKKDESSLKIKQKKFYNHYRQNCSNTKTKFFTPEMEFVSDLDFQDPNNIIKKNIIQLQKKTSFMEEKTNEFINSYTKLSK